MLKIGITGGIGSGKTTVCRIFEIIGIPVFYADEESKYLVQSNDDVINAIKSAFGGDVYRENAINRKLLADIVFKSPEKLAILNSIVHPAVFKKFDEWVNSKTAQTYVLKEAALIFETGADVTLDGVIVVTAPEYLRIKRVMLRDGSSETEVQNRIKNQMPESEKLKRAYHIINNDERSLLIPQVLSLHKKLLQR